MQKPVLTVTEVNKYIKDILSYNPILSNCLVKGEISNFKSHYSGHLYFTLKDENSVIKCVMFRNSGNGLKFEPQDGMKVIIAGRISVYERDGNYQLYVDDMQPDGLGALHLAFEQLKKKLELEGLFDESRKKPLPVLPNAIGIITSPTGAAVRDILNILTRRFFNVKVTIIPVQVQGEGSSEQIAQAINIFNKLNNVDVIILARGGGSIEELWSFNEEIVARAIASSDIPIVSGVGHETDFTIADFVSDMRAPTPSAAAELIVPNKIDLEYTINNYFRRLNYAMNNKVDSYKTKLENYINSRVLKSPLDSIYQNRMRLDILYKDLIKDSKSLVNKNKSTFVQLLNKLNGLSPLSIMLRGYSYITKDNKSIKTVKDIDIGDKLNIQFSDGYSECVVENICGVKLDGKEDDI